MPIDIIVIVLAIFFVGLMIYKKIKSVGSGCHGKCAGCKAACKNREKRI